MKLSGIQQLVCQTVEQYELFQPGTKTVIGLSGGKDSMAMTGVLASLREYFNIGITAVYINNSYDLQPKPLPEEIRCWLKELNIPCMEIEAECTQKTPLSCYGCSRLRKQTLLKTAAELGADSLCLAHTLDDTAETVLKELLEKGSMGTILPKRNYFGVINLVRPFIMVPSAAVISYVRNHSVPVMNNSCPLSATSKRAQIRAVLEFSGRYFPDSSINLAKAGNIDINNEKIKL